MLVKVCGVTNVDDARAAADCGADFVGLILAPGARRVTMAAACEIARVLPWGVEPVFVFRDAGLEEIYAAVAASGVRWVQLHGREAVSQVGELAAAQPQLNIIKAWEVASPTAAEQLSEYLREAEQARVKIDVVILDAPKGGPHPGFPCLAEVSRTCRLRPPQVWCAGGLTPENVSGAVSTGTYDGVDIASGIEASPGKKDLAAMQRFVETAKLP